MTSHVLTSLLFFSSFFVQLRSVEGQRNQRNGLVPGVEELDPINFQCSRDLRPRWRMDDDGNFVFPGFCPGFFDNVRCRLAGANTENFGNEGSDSPQGDQYADRADACLCEFRLRCTEETYPSQCDAFFQREVYGTNGYGYYRSSPRPQLPSVEESCVDQCQPNCVGHHVDACETACWALAYQCGLRFTSNGQGFEIDNSRTDVPSPLPDDCNDVFPSLITA